MRVSKILCFFQWQADQFWRFQQIIGLRDNSPYFAMTDFNDITALSFDHQVSSFHEYLWNVNWSPILTQEQSQEGEKCGFFYAWAEYYLQPNTVGRHCAFIWADVYLYAVLCRLRGGLLANEKEEKFASNDKIPSWGIVVVSICTVCDVSTFKPLVFKKVKFFAVLQFPVCYCQSQI